MTREELAAAIYKVSHLTGKFLLRSGATSSEYFDKYLFESSPEILREIAKQMAPLIPAGVEVLAGLEMGGIPLAAALSLETGLPTAFVRKKAKQYGTAKISEGASIKDKNVLIIEDVVTSGGQIILSSKDLKDQGAKLANVLCVIDREAGGSEALEKESLKLIPLFKMSYLKEKAL